VKGCVRARRQLALAADGELAIDGRLELDRHLERCAACRAERDALDALEEALLDLPEPPLASLALERAVAGVRARVAGEPDGGNSRGRRAIVPRGAGSRRRFALAGAGLLAAALVAGLGWLVRRAVAPERATRPNGPIEVATEVPETPETHAVPAIAPSADAIDPARLAAARAAVAAALAEAFEGVPLLGAPAEIELAVRDFEARTAELARDWPVLRIAQGLVAQPDDALAGAALRVLGRRGDVLSARVLRDALERPALAAAAASALGDLGPAGLAGLAEVLRRPVFVEIWGLARARIVAIGGERAANVLGAALRESAPASADAQALLDALVAVEPCPAAAVLDLIRDGALDAERGYRALAATPAAARALLALTRDGGPATRELLGALAVAQPADALPWIAARATERDHRDAACASLAAYATADALDVLRDLHARGRAPQALVRASVASLLEAVPSAAADLARRGAPVANGAGEIGNNAQAVPALRARELLDLLLDVGTPSAGPGLAALAFQSALPADDRPWAALAVGELGGRAENADLLAEGVAQLGAQRETLAAAALLAATALGRPEAVLLALDARGRLDRARADAILALCASARDEGTRAVTLFKVARELRPHFDDPKL
jgi:hypothetical protein